jgi:hypothetical protein
MFHPVLRDGVTGYWIIAVSRFREDLMTYLLGVRVQPDSGDLLGDAVDCNLPLLAGTPVGTRNGAGWPKVTPPASVGWARV